MKKYFLLWVLSCVAFLFLALITGSYGVEPPEYILIPLIGSVFVGTVAFLLMIYELLKTHGKKPLSLNKLVLTLLVVGLIYFAYLVGKESNPPATVQTYTSPYQTPYQSPYASPYGSPYGTPYQAPRLQFTNCYDNGYGWINCTSF